MAFAEVYGPEVESLIHVHHLVPLSTVGQQYEVDPIRDLRPVCPNCHAVIHSRVPAYTIEEIRKMFTANSAGIGAFPQA
jgi:5-methylcytosine-specific restriction protein A